MQVALLHHCTLSELSKKMSDQEYMLWAAHVEIQRRNLINFPEKSSDRPSSEVSMPQHDVLPMSRVSPLSSSDVDEHARRVEHVLRM